MAALIMPLSPGMWQMNFGLGWDLKDTTVVKVLEDSFKDFVTWRIQHQV